MEKSTSSYESYDHLNNLSKEVHMNHMNKPLNKIPVKERDYMIRKAMDHFKIAPKFRPTVAKAANYIDGPRFWELYDLADRAEKKGHYFIKIVNREMYGVR